jgi:voltage-gated potassium channel
MALQGTNPRIVRGAGPRTRLTGDHGDRTHAPVASTGVTHLRRLRAALALLGAVLALGTIGYLLLGFGFIDALYQTVTTVATVGFREVQPLSTTGKVFTIVLILLGVGTTLYALSVLIETLFEGRLQDLLGRRRMERTIDAMHGHVIICGWGRVGRSIAGEVSAAGRDLVVIDENVDRLEDCPYANVVGDATEDTVLSAAGLDRAAAVVAAVDQDAANSFITLSARARRPDIFIVTRARSIESEEKLRRAGADRVVNPQNIGGARMAAFVLRPNVAEFLDVVMRERNLEFRLEELEVDDASPIAGSTLAEAHLRDRTGALVLALRDPEGRFVTNPAPHTTIAAHHVLIAIGTEDELSALSDVVRG